MFSAQNSAGWVVRHSWSQHCSFKGCSALMAGGTSAQIITGQGLGWVVLPTMAQGRGGLIWDQRHLLRVSMIISLCKHSRLCTGPCVRVRQRSLAGYSSWGCRNNKITTKQHQRNVRLGGHSEMGRGQAPTHKLSGATGHSPGSL